VAGTGLIVTTTAIGVIGPPDDTGTCQKNAYCLPMTFGSTPTSCQINGECAAGKTCRTAFCGGICNTGPTVGQSCGGDADCTGSAGSCTAGANFGVACTGTVAGECGGSNICRAVDPAKGVDGLPCTDDDPVTSQGTAQTIASTTSTASASIVDLSDNTNGGTSFGMLYGTVCSGFASCTTAVTGSPFDCSASTGLLASTPSAHGAGLASAFPQLDSASTGDNVVTNRQTAR